MCKTRRLTCLLSLSLVFTSQLSAAESEDRLDLRTLVLVPAAEPAQALQYRLLPDFLDQANGNAALFYHGAAELCPDTGKDDLGDNIERWLTMEVDQLPREEVDRSLESFADTFHQIKLATLRKQCEWDMPLEEGFQMLIPGLATHRDIARALALRLRLEIADERIDEALQSLQQGLSLARGVAQGGTLIQDLVGIAICVIMMNEAEALAEASKSPNLYWAFTALPMPMIDVRAALEYERGAIFLALPHLRRLDSDLLTAEQASAMVTDFFDEARSLGLLETMPLDRLMPHAWVMLHYTDAKQYLMRHGVAEDRVEAMPAAQAVMLYQVQEHLALQDSLSKWLFFPHYLAKPRFEEAKRGIAEATQSRGLKGNLLTAGLLPALSRVSLRRARHQRQIALLRTIEALRMYAADHEGRLPSALAEIQSVPIPQDPVTGKAFLYKLRDDGSARLEAPPAPDDKNRRPVYEMTVHP